MKQSMKLAAIMAGIVILSIVTGILLMTGLYAIPTSWMKENAKDSAPLFEEGNNLQYNNWASGQMYTNLADYTDSIMVNTAMARPTGSALQNAMLNAHVVYRNTEAPRNLVRYVSGDDGYEYETYARYWHGYLLYLIPGLCLMDLGQIRIVMLFFQFFAALIFLWELGKRNRLLMLLFGVVILFINPVTTALSIGEANVYCVMMLTSLVVLRAGKKLTKKGLCILFLAGGICTAFFDLLTYPVVAFAIPLLILLGLKTEKLKKGLLDIVCYGLSWGMGYAGMWGGKWIAGSLITGKDVIRDAAETIQFRMNGEWGEGTNYRNAMGMIWRAVYSKPMFILLLIFLAILCYFIIRKGYRFEVGRTTVNSLIPVGIVGLIPFVWYLVAMNHTYIHPDVTYRELAITISSIAIILAAVLKKPGVCHPVSGKMK